MFDYHSDPNHKGCIVRDERRDEIDKKRYIARDEIDQKEYKTNISFPEKKLRAAVSKSSYTLIKLKKICNCRSFQKLPFADVPPNSCSYKFSRIDRKRPVSKSFF